MHREDEEAFEQEAKARLIQDGDDKWEASKWLGRTGWPRHLEGIDQGELKALMRAIGDDEPELQQMWRVFNTVLDEAYAATERCYPGTAELFEIARKEVSSETPTMPFQGKMEVNAWTKYKDKWRILLCIWVRVEFWDEEDRPKYRMTIGQRKAFELFSRAIHETITGADVVGRWTEDRVRRSCLDMVIEFLDHRFRNGDHYRSIIISALAIMGLADGGGDMDMVSGWLTAMDYTPTYSAVIKVARYLVLYQSILERSDQVGRLQQVMSEEEADEKAEGLFRIVRRKVRGFMTRTSGEEDAEPTPMNWIINTRTYGLRIRYTTPGSETIDWRGDQIIHGRIRIRMGEIADMLHNLVGRARETLSRLTMTEGGGAGEFTARGALPVIPWSQIEDQHGESIIDHSFLRNAGNAGWLAAGNDWVIKMIISRPDKWAEWMVEGAENNEYREHPYRGAAIRQYARDVEQFRGEIFMLMHMLGGQPARSTEILGLRMWNTMNGGVRNIFIHEGMVCFVTMYHKGFRQTGNTKIIHRYVPREVGELLVWYMWLVLPFWQNVQGRLKQKRRRSAFYSPRPYETETSLTSIGSNRTFEMGSISPSPLGEGTLRSPVMGPRGDQRHSARDDDICGIPNLKLHNSTISGSSKRESISVLPDRSASPSPDAHEAAESDWDGIRQDGNIAVQEEDAGDGLLSDVESQSEDTFETDLSSESDVSDAESEMDINDTGIPSESDLYLAKGFLERTWRCLCDCQEQEQEISSEDARSGLSLKNMADYWRNLAVPDAIGIASPQARTDVFSRTGTRY
ncbi:hypothetical protein FOPG_19254 [Fusarium oxysporum f. sp. conglutinans race 2 54008]|uniref:Uncharacterized protein n=1 Tax=Fusarium oxysporum f. sp. conglutinans race 2 54008 TaxID=1089457 RepID=X0GLJ9_FUSOX|nr:hypothetical protein FOPG_19254 [Fusarium oxysporum f. sp. conglutinans race 2 54008]